LNFKSFISGIRGKMKGNYSVFISTEIGINNKQFVKKVYLKPQNNFFYYFFEMKDSRGFLKKVSSHFLIKFVVLKFKK
jgi:hypothetical protein